MLVGETIVAQVDHGAAPPNWQVMHGRPAYHLWQIVWGVIIVVLGIVGAIFLLANPNQAFSYGAGGEASMSVINTWRTIDFVAMAILVFTGAYLIVQHAGGFTSARSDLLVMLPEGFVVRTGQRIQAFDFAALTNLRATLYRGKLTFTGTPATGGPNQRGSIDGRFGKLKPLGRELLTAYNHYRAAAVRQQG